MRVTNSLATGLVALSLAAGCGAPRTDRPVITSKDGDSAASPSGRVTADAGTTLVRLVNAIPNRAGIDVSGADRRLFTNIPYQGVTPYAEIRPNTVTFKMLTPGSDSVLADHAQIVGDGLRYTIIAFPGDKGQPKLRMLRDDLRPDSGMAKLRVINAASDIGTVDLRISGRKDALLTNVGFDNEADYKNISPTRGSIEINPDMKQRRALVLQNVTLEGGRAYTIVLAGWGTDSVHAIRFEDAEAGGLGAGGN